MNKISFFTAVSCENNSKSKGLFLLEKVDSYFYLGGKKAKIEAGHTKGNAEAVCLIDSTSSLTALKVASYCTVIIPLILLIAKAILRSNYDFYLLYREKISIIDLNLTPPTSDRLAIKTDNSSTSTNIGTPSAKNSQTEDESSKQAQEKAALSVQCALRKHLAHSRLQTLKKEKLEQQGQKAQLTAQPVKKVERSIPKFSAYTVVLSFPKHRKEEICICSEDGIELMVKRINDEICQHHTSMLVYFKEIYTSNSEIEERIKCFQKAPSATHLQFRDDGRAFIRVQPKPIKIEDLGDGRIHRTYANGIIEVFRSNDRAHEGKRVFPTGEEELGKFDGEGKFVSGYRINLNKQMEFINPSPLISYEKEQGEGAFEICEVEGKLVILEKTYSKDLGWVYTITDVSIEEILLKGIQRPSYGDGKTIKDVLFHKEFSHSQKTFIEYVLASEESGTPRLFSLSNSAAFDVMEAGLKIESIGFEPLKIIDPISGRNFILQAAHWGSNKLLDKLIELFPKEFLTIGQQVIAELLQQEHSDKLVDNIAKKFESLGGVLDTYHLLWLKVAQSIKPDEGFKKDFASFSKSQLRTLYDTAYVYNNPFIHEPSDTPIDPNEYSINLMWINEKKIPKDQAFLFGKGSTDEEQKLDFHERFVKPVSEWARRNPGSIINIWIDREMAPEAVIERSRTALQDFLGETSSDKIQFRDVRSIDVVDSNPKAFNANIKVYLRVDLLRAITADYILRKKETKFCVYADIDMKPLSGKEIFDKRTDNFLKDFGIVMAYGGHLGFENGFQILNGDNPKFMDSHRKVIIDLSVEMILEKPKAVNEQQIYDTYPAMITHFLDADGRYGKLKDSKPKSEDPSVMLSRFRYDKFGTSAHTTLPFGEGNIKLDKIMPRKPVRLPPSHF